MNSLIKEAEKAATDGFFDVKLDILGEDLTGDLDEALCEAFHYRAVIWGDYLQQAETQEEADFINKMIDKYESESDFYCKKS